MDHFLEALSANLLITREYLRAGVLVSLLSVWVLVALFYYLNRYTKRRYFTIWTAAWLFYALWMTLSFGMAGAENRPLLMMLQQWCVGVSAVFLMWGSLDFLGKPVRQGLLAWFMTFLFVWSYIGAYHLNKPEMELPSFWLIAAASVVTAFNFLKYRNKHPYIGATLLSLGFFLWAVYMASYPFMENSKDLTSVALFVSAGLQLMLAVSMIILVLEEVRETQQIAQVKAHDNEVARDALQSRVLSTEERYQKLFAQASEAILITDAADFRILELNRAAERLLGISRVEAGKQSLRAFCEVHTRAGAPVQSSEEWFLSVCRQRPLNFMRKNGALAPVEVNGAMIDFDGRAAYQFFILELTERAQLEQQLRQAEKLSAIGRMVSGVAHELNNPLSVVKGYLELVLAHHNLPPQTRSDLEKAAHESNRAAKLVMNFLSLAREQPFLRKSVNLNELVQRIVDLRRFDLAVAKTKILLELATELPAISADPDQIHQLIVNLMNNALQAMVDLHQPGLLKIITHADGNLVQLRVEDNGPGVPPHLVNKIFEPFFTTKDVGTGTGLGLSIAHTIMSEHKGSISYQTSSLGGAGFILEFPAANIPAANGKLAPGTPTTFLAETPEPEPEQKHAGSILVLDDEKSIAEMLAEMLGLLGYTPTICNAPAHALEMLEDKDFDLIISDFRMPGINGRQFYELATAIRPALAQKIIFLTGDVVNEETQEFLKSIGNPHIAKPFNLSSVKKVVEESFHPKGKRRRAPAPLLA
ncbi:MAG TPA: ATP-binding protein [Verrucomicrobiae bacterium]|nr:ATP-binding protein [Verrucomicrobiae bacterium]